MELGKTLEGTMILTRRHMIEVEINLKKKHERNSQLVNSVVTLALFLVPSKVCLYLISPLHLLKFITGFFLIRSTLLTYSNHHFSTTFFPVPPNILSTVFFKKIFSDLTVQLK